MSAVRTALVGAHGFERATVWSAVGFALGFLVFDVATLPGGAPVEWIAGVCALVVVLGVVGFARIGGGIVPCTVLAYGPFAGILLRTPNLGLLPLPAAEPFALALAAAVGVVAVGYPAGRLLAPAEPGAAESTEDGESTEDAESTETAESPSSEQGSTG